MRGRGRRVKMDGREGGGGVGKAHPPDTVGREETGEAKALPHWLAGSRRYSLLSNRGAVVITTIVTLSLLLYPIIVGSIYSCSFPSSGLHT